MESQVACINSLAKSQGSGMSQEKYLRALRQDPAAQRQLRFADVSDRIMFLSKSRKKLTLARNIIVHGNDNRRLYLFDNFHDLFKPQIGHSIDRDHHHVDPLHYPLLFRSEKVADVTQMGETETSHFVDEY